MFLNVILLRILLATFLVCDNHCYCSWLVTGKMGIPITVFVLVSACLYLAIFHYCATVQVFNEVRIY